MFFIGIFGIENKEKDIKILSNLSCKKCNLSVTGRLIKAFSYFHFFFIPLFKWDEKYYVVCDNCRTVYSISKEKGKAVEHGENIDVTYWDLQEEVYNEYYNDNYYKPKKCSNCDKIVEPNFKYCPHCGAKI
jgi:hypothetical protein